MTISPIQPIRGDYVARGEFNMKFNEQKEYMDTGFGKIDEKIDHVERNLGKKIDALDKKTEIRFDSLESRLDEQDKYMKDGFEKVFKQIDEVESGLGEKIDGLDRKVDSFKGEVNQRFNSLDSKIDGISTQITLLTKVVNNIVK